MTYLPENAIRDAMLSEGSRVLTVLLQADEMAWLPGNIQAAGPLVVQYIHYRDGDLDYHVLPAWTVDRLVS